MTRSASADELAAARQPGRSYGHVLEATRQSLLDGLKNQSDQAGWQRFFDLYSGAIHGLALKAGLAPGEADDVLQETLLSVVRQMPGFNYDPAHGTFKGWLFLITRRRIADHFRKRKPTVELQEDVPDESAGALESEWDQEWRRNVLKLALEAVKEKVSARQWQMFDLAALQQWPMERITALVAANRAQVYMAKMRVSRLVRLEAERLGRDLPPGLH